jgi:hypothetical protein
MDNVEHGPIHRDVSDKPECLCGAEVAKDTMWDRYYCSMSHIWLEGPWGSCWCNECLTKPRISEEDELLATPCNEWCNKV